MSAPRITPYVMTSCRECDSTGKVEDFVGGSEDHHHLYVDCGDCAGSGVRHCDEYGCCARVEVCIEVAGRKSYGCGDVHCQLSLKQLLIARNASDWRALSAGFWVNRRAS